MEIQHFSHEHPLALCSSGYRACRACKKSISGPAYGCTQCQYFIHKSCGELPPVIQYPFHPKHPLTLLAKAPYHWRKFNCSMCKKRHFAFTYHCSECNFDVDIPCSQIRPSDEQQVRHSSHWHPLISVTLYGCSTSFSCSACEGIVEDLAYACWKCNFIIHKSCYDLPEEIQHRLHPQHPLTLLAKSPYSVKQIYCNACNRKFAGGFTYHCSECEFDLHIICSLEKPLPNNKNYEQHIQHLSHPHPLFILSLACKYESSVRCNLCEKPSSHLMYACLKCKYFIHVSCAEFPPEIRHPFHPHHLLTLCENIPDYMDSLICYACQGSCTEFAFRCSQCNFRMHFRCSLFVPTINHEETMKKTQHFSHQHPLIPVTLFEEDYNFRCSMCREIISGSIYICIKCKFFIHKSCVDLPQEILHPFHPAHPLRLLPQSALENYRCTACQRYYYRFLFQCFECSFRMCVKCAMNTCTTSTDHDCCESPIQHYSHPHPLIPIKAALFPWKCRACNKDLGATCYSCFQCMYFLEKSCLELPYEIQHPIHCQHPLRILNVDFFDDDDNDYDVEQYQCKVCGTIKFTRLFVYHCAECNFMICSECESRPTVKYELHEHLLVYMGYFSRFDTYQCYICHVKCENRFFHCAECNMNLHVQCIPVLPVTGKHRTHRHVLTLTDPLPEDDTNEYYCDACEKERNPKHSVYYCAKCEFAAHIECGMSEVVLSNNEESSVACRLMDAGISISDIDSEEEVADEESDVGDFNISILFEERVSDKEGTEYEEEIEEMAVGEEQADQEPYVTEEEEEANQESDVSADSSELEKEMDGVREKMVALARKLEALQQRKRKKKSHVASQAQM